MTAPRITDRQRQARLGNLHRLAPRHRLDSVATIAADLVALHSSDPVSVYLSAVVRMRDGHIGDVDAALYVDRSVVRHHAMRRTLWVFPTATVGSAHRASTAAVYAAERKRLAGYLVASGITDEPLAWIDLAGAQLLEALLERGEATTRQLGEALPHLTVPVEIAAGTTHGGPAAAHTRLVLLLGFQGAVVRSRPIGTWVSGQYRWAPMRTWIDTDEWRHSWIDPDSDADAAMAELVGRYLARFGPATLTDVQWWTGSTKAATNRALAAIGAIPVETEHGPGYLSADAPEPDADDEPWVALLPSLDPTTMGWKQRQWFMPASLERELFDRNGNAGPTVWANGRVVGGWVQRADGTIAVQVGQLSAVHRRLLDTEIERMRSLLGDARVTVRFPSPVSRSLRQ